MLIGNKMLMEKVTMLSFCFSSVDSYFIYTKSESSSFTEDA